MSSSDLIQGIQAQSKFSISQAISLVEKGEKAGNELLSDLFRYTGYAYRIGITGPPGSGKSSLTNNLISILRKGNKRVAVVAIDPTSPFSDGAILGDRIRMVNHYSDPHVFIRSMATRGSYGGLSIHSEDIALIFDAAKFDVIIYETVGVGQIELDIVQAADSIIVVLVPESGDEVQMLKAGLMEIGDIFAINKADRPGANKLMITLKNILSSFHGKKNVWIPEVIHTIATEGKGIEKLLNSISSHKSFLKSGDIYNKKYQDRYKHRVNNFIKEEFIQKFWNTERNTLLQRELQKEIVDRLSPFALFKYFMKNE